jgi:hypothetical protein
VRRRSTRLAVEQLEDRTVPSNFPVANVDQLIAAINDANQTPEADTITLVTGTTFTLTQVNNTTNGPNGLPTIAAAGGPLTILGNGDTIERSTASGTPAFRLFDVAVGASLTLANVTVQGGLAESGGGIYSSGSLTLEAGTIIRGNHAVGHPGSSYNTWFGTYAYPGGPGFGGGVYVAGGTATVTNATLSSNSARGGDGFYGLLWGEIIVSDGGPGRGGGLYVAGGTVTVSNTTLSSNSALGGDGFFGGEARGGGLYVAGGTVTLRSDTVTGNLANGGRGSNGKYNGSAYGGSLYIDPAAVVYLDALTQGHTKSNKPGNIYGSYTLLT